MTNELIHDVEESLKQEQIHAMWKEYGPYIIGGVVLAVLLTALLSGWRSWEYKVNAADTDLLIEAMAEENVPEALAEIEDALRPGQKAMAYLTHAGMYLQENKPQDALNVLKQGTADSAIPAPYDNLVKLQTLRLQWGLEKDTAPRDLLAALEPLINNRDNPWRWHAREQAALIMGDGLGEYDAAQQHLDIIIKAGSQNVPGTLVQRAQALKAMYAQKSKTAPASATDEPGPAKEE